MKAVLMDGFGGVEVLKLGEAPVPVPKDDQVLIRVMATSVNRPDLVQRVGKYPPPPGDSEILGLEVAGVVQEVGGSVKDFKAGDRVMSLVGGGGYAEFAVAYQSHLMRIPDSMTFEEAACVCECYITAFLNVLELGDLKAGETALLHGGGGGVNTAALQLCRALVPTSRLIVTASPQKVQRVKELGAELVVNYREHPDFTDVVLDFTGKKGVDVILDHIGADYFQSNMKSLGVKGRLVVIGVTSGIKAELNLALMMVKRQQIIGSVLRARPVPEKGGIVARFVERALPKLADRTIVPLIDTVLPLDAVREAHARMEESRHFGKIVLKVG